MHGVGGAVEGVDVVAGEELQLRRAVTSVTAMVQSWPIAGDLLGGEAPGCSGLHAERRCVAVGEHPPGDAAELAEGERRTGPGLRVDVDAAGDGDVDAQARTGDGADVEDAAGRDGDRRPLRDRVAVDGDRAGRC